jgi:hypothetical protein
MTGPVAPTAADRLLAAVRAIIRAEVPTFTYAGTYEYSVQGSSGTTVDLSPVDTSISLPSMTGLPVKPSILAEVVGGIQAGQLALVQFVNADPTRPVVVSLEMPSQTATLDATQTTTLGSNSTVSVALAAGTAPIARQGDMITVFLLPSPSMVSGVLAPLGLNFVGVVTFVSPATGMITGGNPKVQA